MAQVDTHPVRNRVAPALGGLLAAALSALFLAGCGDISISFVDDKNPAVRGNGNKAADAREVAAFDRIEASGAGMLIVRVGEKTCNCVKVSADENLMSLIRTDVRDGVLVISTKSAYRSKNDVVVEVGAKAIKRIENSGAMSVDASGFNGGSLQLDLSGVGNVTLAGRVDGLKIDLSGVGNIDAEELRADAVEADLSGVGRGTIRAEKSIRANVSGVGGLTWKGAATVVSTNVSGIGRVSKG